MRLAAPGVRAPVADPALGERAARGLDRVHIVRTWRAPVADGSTDLLLDVFNGGSRPLAGLVVDLVDEAAAPGVARAQTCHLGVWIPAGRVARASCARPVTDSARLVPRIVDVYWQ